MKKFFRRFFRVLLVLLILGILLALASTFVFQKQIGNRIIAEVNEQIESELSAEDIGLSIWPNFPKTFATLNGVKLTDARGQTLVEADKVALELKLTSLFSSNYIIYGLQIEKGDIYLHIDPAGAANYNILKNGGDSRPPSKTTNVSIDKATLSNMRLHYQNEQQRHKAEFLINNMEIEGEFSARRFEMKNTAALKSDFYDTDQLRFFENKNIEYSSFVNVDLNAQSYDLSRAMVVIDEQPFRMEGDIEKWEKGYFLDLFISSENSQLKGPVQLLPTAYEKLLGEFESEGNTNFTAVVKGLWGENQNPELKAELQLQQGRIRHPQLEEPIDSAQFAVLFNNGDLKSFQTSSFEIRDFQGQLDTQALQANLLINNFENPNIDLTFDGQIPLQIVQPLIKEKDVQNLQGGLAVREFQLNGRYENMISPGYMGLVETGGQFELQDVQFTLKDDTTRVRSGLFDLNDNKLTVSQLQLKGLDSDLKVEGAVFNVIPYLLADSINSEDVELEFDATVQSNQLDLDQVLVALELLQDSTSSRSGRQLLRRREAISQFLKGTVSSQIDSFTYRGFSGKNFEGNINFANNELQVRGTAEAFGGQVGIDGELMLEYRPKLETRLTLQGVNTTTFLRQSGQFNQDFITDQNLAGQLEGSILLEASWDENGRFLNEKLKTMANLQFSDGFIQKLPPQQSWSRFIKAPQMDSIAFTEAQAYLEIRRRKVYVPLALIRADSFRLTVSGEHRFNDNFRYHVKLNAAAPLARKIDESREEAQPTASNQAGYYNFYHTIYGHRQDFDIRQARDQVKSEFERSDIRRSEIHKTLLQAFDEAPLFEEPRAWKDEEVIKEVNE